MEIVSERWTPKALAAAIDHTLLRPTATPDDVRALCEEAVRYGFASACIAPCHVSLAAEILTGSPTAVCTVIGFPLGSHAPAIKAEEARWALQQGARELDMVLNLGWLKGGWYDAVEEDIRRVVEAAAAEGALVKVILETCFLSDEEKVTACALAERGGARFVKTSTGFGSGGAVAADVRLLRSAVGSRLGVKASGGIKTLADARTLLAAGADRLGSSSGVAIVEALGTL